jgi:hypothetical protein
MHGDIQILVNLPELAEGITRDIGDVAMQIATGIEGEAKRLIQQTVPAGRTYRRGAINRPANSKLLGMGLKLSRTRQGRVVAGYSFHRASAPGQPPANDTSNLVNSIKAKRTGEVSATLDINAGYAGFLEPPADLNRPFVAPAIDFVLENVLPNL